jgi:hypothetical protein
MQGTIVQRIAPDSSRGAPRTPSQASDRSLESFASELAPIKGPLPILSRGGQSVVGAASAANLPVRTLTM